MSTAACPSCGAPLRFRGATSVVAVCAFCRATLVREGARLEDIGKQAGLLEDHSPLRLGTTGRHRGNAFSVVGRIQYRYGAGLWNEWHVLVDDGRSAWLSDASREYTISYLAPPEEVPPFEALSPGRVVTLGGQPYSVANREEAEVVAGEGELPFRFLSGWKAPVADLRGARNAFATLDYSEDVPHVYLGERLPFEAFGFAGLRDPEAVGIDKTGRALAFKCGGCGAPLEKHLATTEVIACPACATVTDVHQGVAELVQKNERNEAKARPSIPLGSEGTWKGVRYEVVGYLRRAVVVEGERYEWSEYLLHNVKEGYAWISEYQGHFSFIRDAAEVPRAVQAPPLKAMKPRVRYLGREFEHFQRANASVSHLAGEFYWRVKVGDTCEVNDYIAPPLVLSSEATQNEITWSLGEYVEPAALWKAFDLKSRMPRPVGVAANQPSPHAVPVRRHWVAFLVLAALALAWQLLFYAGKPAGAPPPVAFEVQPGESSRTVSGVFELGGRSWPVTVRTRSSARDSWIALGLQLVNADSGRAFEMRREIGYRMLDGTPVGGSDDVAEFRNVPPGRYTLAVQATAPARTAFQKDWGPLRGQVRLQRAAPGWSNFFLLLGFLALWPLAAQARHAAFEHRRWEESDYPAASLAASDDDEDD